jgi:hypothetical protein
MGLRSLAATRRGAEGRASADAAGYKKATFYSNGKIKPNVLIVGKNTRGKSIEELHAKGLHEPQRLLAGRRYRRAGSATPAEFSVRPKAV